MKDHKDSHPNRISCRLTISSKSDIGKINKSILNDVNPIQAGGGAILAPPS